MRSFTRRKTPCEVTAITASCEVQGCNANTTLEAQIGLTAGTMMSEKSKNPAEIVKCPLCEGRGEMSEDTLLDRLREKDLARKLEIYLANIVSAARKEELSGMSAEEASTHSADTWNLTHFLWRRSPKE